MTGTDTRGEKHTGGYPERMSALETVTSETGLYP
jgi:hypothetical protein